MNDLSEEEISTGTTIFAAVYDKGVLIGADSRTTSGAFIADRCSDKLDYVHDKIFCKNIYNILVFTIK
jgi:20S proteasome subunit beta 1